ncbi:MAG TPA: hypothetical protein VFV33_05425, partial [Gemmatimonadaceae bacterium]|nr:hypothetical protein [Gemmatimonadaceae bacterium]
GLVVTIKGTGFDQGAKVSWEQGGSSTTAVSVRSVTFVSTTQLSATIDIGAGAATRLYDVVVTTAAGKRAVGAAAFEVSRAVAVPGMVGGASVNEQGAIGGTAPDGAAVWRPGLGVSMVKAGGRLNGLSEDGTTVTGSVTGGTIGCCDGAFVAVLGGSTWQYSVLPKDPVALEHRARAVASDPGSGMGVVVAGSEVLNTTRQRPMLWTRGATGWSRTQLPLPPSGDHDGYVLDVAGVNGPAVGILDQGAAVWEFVNGTWKFAAISGAGSRAWGISRDGQTIVGYTAGSSGTAAARWTLVAGAWKESTLAGGCAEAKDIDNAGRILLDGCPDGGRRSGGVISPPYGAADIRLLTGGGTTSGTAASTARISSRGTWIVGTVTTTAGDNVVVRWPMPS